MVEHNTETTVRRYRIHSFQNGDENAICNLFERVFGKPMGTTESALHWRWEYNENPSKGVFIKLAWDNERLVGQYAASPVQIHAEDRHIVAALSHDTMTDPQYGGIGIFRNTAEALYNEQKSAGHKFIYGFPNGNSIHGFIKNLNWRQIMSAPVHIRPVCVTKNIIRRVLNRDQSFVEKATDDNFSEIPQHFSEQTGRYKLRREAQFGDWADDLWQRCCRQHRLWVLRNKAYLNWRYVARPESKYSIVSIWENNTVAGYCITDCVVKKFGSTLFVLDFLVDLKFKEAANTLIDYIIHLAEISGVLFASALLTPGSKYRQAFRRHCFFPLPERLFPQPLYFGARCFDQEFNSVVFDPGAWSISWGDDDVV